MDARKQTKELRWTQVDRRKQRIKVKGNGLCGYEASIIIFLKIRERVHAANIQNGSVDPTTRPDLLPHLLKNSL